MHHSLNLLINKVSSILNNTSGFIGSPQYQSYTDSFKQIKNVLGIKIQTTVSTSSRSNRPIPFYRKNLWALLGIFFSAAISVGVFVGLAIAGLLATPFISIPVIFAVLAIVLVVKIAMDNKPPSVVSHVIDDKSWSEHVDTSESTTSKKSQDVFAPVWQREQKFKEEQIEKMNDFLVNKALNPDDFLIEVFYPRNNSTVAHFSCSTDLNNDEKAIRELNTKLGEKFVYNDNTKAFEISLTDFEQIYKPSIPPTPF